MVGSTSHEVRLANIAHFAENTEALHYFASEHIAVNPHAQLMLVDTVPIYLPKKEHGLLALMARQPDEVVPYDEVFREVWSVNPDILNQSMWHSYKRTMHVHLGTLLRRMGSPYNDPSKRVIQTIRGIGLLAPLEYDV